MKKLNKLVLNKAKVMSAPQMEHITGGRGGATQEECCCLLWEIGSQDDGVDSGSIYGWMYGWQNYCGGFNSSWCS